jgi:hypothetical protein
MKVNDFGLEGTMMDSGSDDASFTHSSGFISNADQL